MCDNKHENQKMCFYFWSNIPKFLQALKSEMWFAVSEDAHMLSSLGFSDMENTASMEDQRNPCTG